MIDRNHPSAAELVEIARDLMENVETCDADNHKGTSLFDRVVELAGDAAFVQLFDAWRAHVGKKHMEAARVKAAVWFARFLATDPDDRPEANEDFLEALCSEARRNGSQYFTDFGLLAVFSYGYQQGQQDRAEQQT